MSEHTGPGDDDKVIKGVQPNRATHAAMHEVVDDDDGPIKGKQPLAPFDDELA
jgi:hypothetical protein